MYTRQFDVHARDSLAKLARWVRPGSTVLELGPAAGYFTRHMQEAGCVIDAVEIDPQAAAEAGRFARTVIVGDLADAATLAPLSHRQYDAIVCADVLEHIADGDALLQRLRPLLAPGGCLLLSVPNVAHSAVIAGLLDEEFEYSAEGLLDASHVHLYTRRSLDRLLRGAGFRIDQWDAVLVGLHASEFRTRLERFRPEVADVLLARPNAMVYQWLLRACPGEPGASASAPAIGSSETVPLRLLDADADQEFTLDRAVRLTLPVGEVPVVVEAGLRRPAESLRLLLADRIGVIDLADVELIADGRVVWSLARDDSCRAGSGALRLDARRWALIEPDAFIEPIVDAQALRGVDRIRVTAAWPLASGEDASFASFEALAHALARSRAESEGETGTLKDLVGERDRLLSATQQQLQEVEAARAEHEGALIAARAELANAREASAQLEAVRAELASAGEKLAAADTELAADRAEGEQLVATRAELAAAREDWAQRDAEHHSLRWWLRLPWLRGGSPRPDR